ncbi:MAG: helix-turn-helix domain-containing protein [Planctomycetes bacterium]|nr:helix-turn-helix domain-containing protein [Planctomycetota bacterium]
MTDNKAIAPGDVLREELKRRDWTQDMLARIMGRPASAVNEIITGKRSISAEIARELESALRVSAKTWLKLEMEFQLEQVASPIAIEERARPFYHAPVKEMEKRGWIKRTNTPSETEAELCRYFGVNALTDNPRIKVAARTYAKEGSLNEGQIAWCYRALNLAPSAPATTYTAAKLKGALPELRAMASQPELARRVPRILADTGVRLVIVEHLHGSQISGAALWLDDKRPVIALSLLGDKMDRFWFTLQHEISHILHKDGERLDVDLGEAGFDAWSIDTDVERRANADAAAALIEPSRLDDFIRRKKHVMSQTTIIQFANLIQIHPGIVVGQLQHRGVLGWDFHTKLLPRIREHLVGEALTDGYGHRPTV